MLKTTLSLIALVVISLSTMSPAFAGGEPRPNRFWWPEQLEQRSWTLLLIRNPNPDSTPQRLLGEVEARCRKLGWWGSRVRSIDWVPADRRYDLLRDVTAALSDHHLETLVRRREKVSRRHPIQARRLTIRDTHTRHRRRCAHHHVPGRWARRAPVRGQWVAIIAEGVDECDHAIRRTAIGLLRLQRNSRRLCVQGRLCDLDSLGGGMFF